MDLKVGVKFDSKVAENAVKNTYAELKKSATVDFSPTMNALIAKLKEARSDMDVLNQMMLETKNIGKKLEIRTNLKETEQQAEALMRQIEALRATQSGLNVRTSPLDLTPRRSIQDETALADMRNYYAAQEKESKKAADIAVDNANRQKKSQKELADEARKTALANARLEVLETNKSKNLASEALMRQKVLKEIENTSLAHKKLEAAGVQSQSRLRSNAEFTNKTLLSQRQLAIQLSNQIGTMFSIYAVERFVRKLADVRGEFELQKVSLRAILRDAPAADAIFEQIKQLSVKSPFTFKDLTGYAKQLAAFSIPANELFGTMKRLADVSAGLGVGMDRIVLAFGQVRAASVLRGQELRQFTEAGIPLVELLAEKFTKLKGTVVSSGDVFQMISKKMVSFNDVKDIFDEMTAAGGRFYNMQELQANTLKGRMSNLTDAIDLMFNEIGESSEGFLKGSVNLTTELIRNWETVGKAILSVVAVYGAYKAAVITNTAINGLNTASLLVSASTMGTVSFAEARATIVKDLFTAATIRQMFASSALNAVLAINPYVLAGVGVVAFTGLLWTMYDATTAQESAQKKLNEETEKATKLADEQKSVANQLISTINSETETAEQKIKALNRLKELYPNFIKNMDYHALVAMGAKEQQIELNKAVDAINLDRLDESISKAKEALAIAISVSKSGGSEGIYKTSSGDSRAVEEAFATLSILQQQKQAQIDIAEQAKFDLLTLEEKKVIWQRQLDAVIGTKNALIGAAKNSE